MAVCHTPFERVVVDIPLSIYGHDEFKFLAIKRFIRCQLMIQYLYRRLGCIQFLLSPRFDSLTEYRLWSAAIQHREPGSFPICQPNERLSFGAPQEGRIHHDIDTRSQAQGGMVLERRVRLLT